MNLKSLITNQITQEELLNYYNANITYIPMRKKIYGFVFHYKGINNIFINNSLTMKDLIDTILHELAHIELCQLNQVDNDLFSFKIDMYEDEADKYVKEIMEEVNYEKL